MIINRVSGKEVIDARLIRDGDEEGCFRVFYADESRQVLTAEEFDKTIITWQPLYRGDRPPINYK